MKFVQENILLILTALASGVMLIWPAISRRFGGGAGEVGTVEAVQLINHRDALVLDVREDSEFAAGHIPSSKHIPVGKIGERLKELEKYKGKPIVVICRSGNRSAGASSVLKNNGFTEVRNLKGGMLAWEQANLPVQRKK